jgi:hypothetical protein
VTLILIGKGVSLGVAGWPATCDLRRRALLGDFHARRALKVPISTLRLTTLTMVTGAPGLSSSGPPVRGPELGRTQRAHGPGPPMRRCLPS